MTDFTPPAPFRLGLALGGGGARGLAHVHVLTALEFSGEEDVLLRVFFVRAVLRHIGRGFEALFVEDTLERLSVWQKTIKARRFRDYIVAPGGHILPDMHSLIEPSVRH